MVGGAIAVAKFPFPPYFETTMNILRAIHLLRSTVLPLTIVLSITLVSRLPFIDAGYGNDPDSWGVAETARQISLTGAYSVSRFPGYPVQEVVSSLLWPWGAPVLNLATVFMSVLATCFFYLICRHIDVPYPMLTALVMAFTPVIFIASTATIDYMWALGFLMGSTYFVLRRQPLLAGIFLGGAIGCRITSGVMLAPLAILLVFQTNSSRTRTRDMMIFVMSACSLGAMAFLLPYLTYGPSFFAYNPGVSKSIFDTVIDTVRKASVGVWGRIGAIVLTLCVAILPFTNRTTEEHSVYLRFKNSPMFAAVLVAIVLQGIAFVLLPHESGYLIPVVPLLILLLANLSKRWVYVVLCGAIVISSFVSFDLTGIVPGPVLADHADRIYWLNFIDYVIKEVETLEGRNIVIAGDWYPKLLPSLRRRYSGDEEYKLMFRASDSIEYVYFLSDTRLIDRLKDGWNVYYLPGQMVHVAHGDTSRARALVSDEYSVARSLLTVDSE